MINISEFECRNGHLMAPSMGPNCQICGAPIYRMDGKMNRQLAYEDEEFDRQREEKEDEPYNPELD